MDLKMKHKTQFIDKNIVYNIEFYPAFRNSWYIKISFGNQGYYLLSGSLSNLPLNLREFCRRYLDNIAFT